jgi:flagellar motor switch protein FliN
VEMLARPESAESDSAAEEEPAHVASPAPTPKLEYEDLEDGLKLLPGYVRSLLRIRVPVAVTLASARQSVRRILELGPGSIIQFRKSCEETLTLEVGNLTIAEGEAVKVGDKFGLWITSMTLPRERFHKVIAQVAGEDCHANVKAPQP